MARNNNTRRAAMAAAFAMVLGESPLFPHNRHINTQPRALFLRLCLTRNLQPPTSNKTSNKQQNNKTTKQQNKKTTKQQNNKTTQKTTALSSPLGASAARSLKETDINAVGLVLPPVGLESGIRRPTKGPFSAVVIGEDAVSGDDDH
jgi:type III secretory pathway component EscV